MSQMKEKLVFFDASFASMLRRMLFIFALIAILFFTLYVISSLAQERERLLSQIGTQADFTAATSEAFFDSIGYSLEMAVLQVDDRRGLAAKRALFETILKRHPEIAFISAFDAGGRRLLMVDTGSSLQGVDRSRLSGAALPAHYADNRAFLRASMDDPAPYDVGRTEYGALIHEWRIPIRVTRRDAEGRIEFVVQAAVPLSRQNGLWHDLELLPGTHIGLYRDDGFLQSRWPTAGLNDQVAYGSDERPISPMQEVIDARREKGHYDGYNSNNRDFRVGAYRRLGHLPLTAFVSVPRETVYAHWWQHNYALVITFGVLFAVFFWFARMLLRHENRHSTHLATQASTDVLTRLPNRQAGKNHLRRRLAAAAVQRHRFAVLFLDLDHFKHINDQYGHGGGDTVLKEVTARLRAHLHSGDMLARLGGDEFMAVIGSASREEIARTAARMMAALEEPIMVEGRAVRASLSIGISLYPADGDNAEELLRKADDAMYRVKKTSRNGYAFFGDQAGEALAPSTDGAPG